MERQKTDQNRNQTFGVIFDMDGVIFNTQKFIFESEKILFKELKLEIPEPEHRAYAGKTSWEFWKILKKKYNLKQPLKKLVLRHRTFGFEYIKMQNLQPIEGVVDLIKSLHNHSIKIALATSGWKVRVDWMINSTNDLRRFFSTIVYGDDVAKSKPSPDIFLHAAKKIGIHPRRCVVIEDSCNGIMAAKSAGMVAFGFNGYYSKQKLEKANFTFDNFLKISYVDLKKRALNNCKSSNAVILN